MKSGLRTTIGQEIHSYLKSALGGKSGKLRKAFNKSPLERGTALAVRCVVVFII